MPYLPPHDTESDQETLRAFIAAHPLASLVTHDGRRPDLDLVPLLVEDIGGNSGALRLVGHVARANPLWQGRQLGPVLAVFGPVHHYISPTWYPSKQEHHRVVPTWNYLTVHARGELVVHDDEKFTRAAVARLTQHMEAGRDDPWRMGQAPRDFVGDLMNQIVGISIEVDCLVGKFKYGGTRPEADRLAAADGVAAEGGAQTAPLVRRMRGETP